MAWSNYTEAKTEKGTIEPPLVIEGQTFKFPTVPPAKFGMEMLALIAESGGRIRDTDAMGILKYLMDDADLERLVNTGISFGEMLGILLDLLEEYGFRPKAGEEEPPNLEAPPTSEQNSSESSGRSKLIGNEPTDGPSSETSPQSVGVTSSS